MAAVYYYRLFDSVIRANQQIPCLFEDEQDQGEAGQIIFSSDYQQVSVACLPLYSSLYKSENGKPLFILYRIARDYLFDYPGQVQFQIAQDGGNLVVRAGKIQRKKLLHILLNSILAIMAELRGMITLHASGVRYDDNNAIIFLGRQQAGKSSLLTALVNGRSFFNMFADDLMVVKPDSAASNVRLLPVHSQVRLWPDSASSLLKPDAGLSRVHPGTKKLSLNVPYQLNNDGLELKAIYFIHRCDDPDLLNSTSIQKVSAKDALIGLVKNSHAHRLVSQLGLQPQRLPKLTNIAQHVPGFDLSYPGGFEHLPDIVDDITSHVRNLG